MNVAAPRKVTKQTTSVSGEKYRNPAPGIALRESTWTTSRPPCSSNVVESDPTTAQDPESYAVVGSDSAKLDEQRVTLDHKSF